MKKSYNEFKPTLLLLLATYFMVVCVKQMDLPLVTIGAVLLFVKILIDLTFRNNTILKNYYFDNIILSLFLLQAVVFGVKITFEYNVQMFGILSILIFCAVILYLRYSIISKNALVKKTNKQFEFLSKAYLYVKYLEENNSLENFEYIKSKLSKLIYEHYYIKNNDHIEEVVEEIENGLLNSDYESIKIFIPAIKKSVKVSINDLYKGNEYKEKMYKLQCCNLDINAI